MKKLIILVLSLILLLGAVSCGSKNSGDEVTGGNETTKSVNAVDIIGQLIKGEKVDWSGFTASQKAEIEKAAKEEGYEVISGEDGSLVIKDMENEKEEFQYGGEWPENEFTKLVPKPDFGKLVGAVTEEDKFSVALHDASLDEVREYVKKIAEAGFTENAETVDKDYVGVAVYSYQAENKSGYKFQIVQTMGVIAIIIEK